MEADRAALKRVAAFGKQQQEKLDGTVVRILLSKERVLTVWQIVSGLRVLLCDCARQSEIIRSRMDAVWGERTQENLPSAEEVLRMGFELANAKIPVDASETTDNDERIAIDAIERIRNILHHWARETAVRLADKDQRELLDMRLNAIEAGEEAEHMLRELETANDASPNSVLFDHQPCSSDVLPMANHTGNSAVETFEAVNLQKDEMGDETPQKIERLRECAAALGDRERLRIVFYLREKGRATVTAMARDLQRGQSAISHQLNILLAKGYVTFGAVGKYHWYSLTSELRQDLATMIDFFSLPSIPPHDNAFSETPPALT